MLRAVLFISDSTLRDPQVEQEQMNAIKESSLAQNEKQNITGVLAHYKKHFFNVLEGEPSIIEELICNLKEDQRHKNLAILLDVEHNERIYTDWNLIESPCSKQTASLGVFLQRNIDLLPTIDTEHHDILEDFVINLFS